MAKTRTAFFCQECGAQSPKWVGRCPACGAWNTYVEEVIESKPAPTWKDDGDRAKKSAPLKIEEIPQHKEHRIATGDSELDRVLGGGLVPGSLVLIGGEPGIGKSTLMLQMALSMPDRKILYVSGEESAQQIKMRAERLGVGNEQFYVLTETAISDIFRSIKQLQPGLLVIDSVQTMQTEAVESAPGTVSQVRQVAGELLKYAKTSNVPVFLIGHITKDGSIAGPKVLEHMVDTVIQFEGDRHLAYRILRTTKNRFGSTSELGIYEMQNSGLRQVVNPSEILISQREPGLSGIAIGATIEGNRPLLIEVQSLVSPATYGTPQRSSTGFDYKRLNMLLAVLEKRGGMRLGVQDVFLNIAGGLKVDDPALDLAVAISIVSSYQDVPVHDKVCFAGEVGLGGEVRAVNRIDQRIAEAEKLGFEVIYISTYSTRGLDTKGRNIRVAAFSKLGKIIEDIM
jgi:DNA repair protein RadA/Sms